MHTVLQQYQHHMTYLGTSNKLQQKTHGTLDEQLTYLVTPDTLQVTTNHTVLTAPLINKRIRLSGQRTITDIRRRLLVKPSTFSTSYLSLPSSCRQVSATAILYHAK